MMKKKENKEGSHHSSCKKKLINIALMAIHLSDLDGFGVDPYSELPFLRNLNFKFLYFSENRKKKKNYMQKKKKLYAKKKKNAKSFIQSFIFFGWLYFPSTSFINRTIYPCFFSKRSGYFFFIFSKDEPIIEISYWLPDPWCKELT